MKKVMGDTLYIAQAHDQYYAYIPSRIWYKPWRWRLEAVDLRVGAAQYVSLAYDISKAEVIGMLKLMNVYLGEE